jgi:S1-C subfamily serine protease
MKLNLSKSVLFVLAVLLIALSTIQLTCEINANIAPIHKFNSPLMNLQSYAQSISIKVLAGKEFLGSGVLVKRQNNTYMVVTNAHVLRAGKPPYRIVAHNGAIYRAKISTNNFGSKDIALLEFISPRKEYTVASFDNTVKLSDKVFACGFPTRDDEDVKPLFTMNPGFVSFILGQSLSDGYQIGHTNQVNSGMSGGALLNEQGEIVGIIGKRAYPAWEIPAKFADGSTVPLETSKKISVLSWSIPIKILDYLVVPAKLAPTVDASHH